MLCGLTVDKVRESSSCALVHCLAGISRSPTLAIAYIMRYLGLTTDEAYKYVELTALFWSLFHDCFSLIHVFITQLSQSTKLTKQPHLSAIVQSRRLSLFGHIARMPDETDAKQILTASPAGNWRRPLGRPRITWMKTIQQDLKSSNVNMDDAVDLAQNRPLCRLMSTFGATHS